LAAAYQRRRDVNVERMNRADRLIAMSRRVADIHAELGVDPGIVQTLPLTLGHKEGLTPRVATGRRSVVFATLGGLESPAKGARLLLDAMSSLQQDSGRGVRLLVFGHVDPTFLTEAAQLHAIELRGPFRPAQLDSLLNEVDVGIMPSIWEEAYGYAGLEFLAKGIPVIANEIGGMVDYTREGDTGWLNRSCTAEELAGIIHGVVDRPDQVVALNSRIRANRNLLVKPMARHVEEIVAIYQEVAGGFHDRSP